jgi:TRAP-type C4-dicarboxylate transport system permease small subunit
MHEAAIMAYKTVRGERRTRRGVHLVLHVLALTAGILGIYIIFKFHHDTGMQGYAILAFLARHYYLSLVRFAGNIYIYKYI